MQGSFLLLGQARFLSLTAMLDTGETPLPPEYLATTSAYAWSGLQFPSILSSRTAGAQQLQQAAAPAAAGGRLLLAQEASDTSALVRQACGLAQSSLNMTCSASLAYLAALETSAQKLFLSSILVQSSTALAILLAHASLLVVLWRLRRHTSSAAAAAAAAAASSTTLAFPRFEIAQLVAMYESMCLTALLALSNSDGATEAAVRVVAGVWLLAIHLALGYSLWRLVGYVRRRRLVFTRTGGSSVRRGPLHDTLLLPLKVLLLTHFAAVLRRVSTLCGWRALRELTRPESVQRHVHAGEWAVAAPTSSRSPTAGSAPAGDGAGDGAGGGSGDSSEQLAEGDVRAAQRFLSGFGDLFAGYDDKNVAFAFVAFGSQLMRACLLCFAKGVTQMALVAVLAACDVVLLFRAPYTERIGNHTAILGKLVEVYTLVHLTVVAHIPALQASLGGAATTVVLVNQWYILTLSSISLLASMHTLVASRCCRCARLRTHGKEQSEHAAAASKPATADTPGGPASAPPRTRPHAERPTLRRIVGDVVAGMGWNRAPKLPPHLLAARSFEEIARNKLQQREHSCEQQQETAAKGMQLELLDA